MRYNPTMEPLPQTDEILRRLAEGETLRQVLATAGMPLRQTFLKHVDADFPAGLRDQYARARRDGLDVQAEQLTEIAADDKRDPNSRRVEVDARKWLLSKMRPDKYGDALRQVLSGDPSQPVAHTVTVVYEDRPAKLLDKGGD